MTGTSGEELAAAGSIVASLFAAALVGVILARAQREIVGPPAGWALVAVSLVLLALRVFGHFIEWDLFQIYRRFAGILAAILLPLGLLLVFRGLRRPAEVSPDGR